MDQLVQLATETGWDDLCGPADRAVLRWSTAEVYARDTPLRFSVVVNTCNRADLLAHCLIALPRQVYRAFEVIVVVAIRKLRPSRGHATERAG